jgi:hypothetical protein
MDGKRFNQKLVWYINQRIGTIHDGMCFGRTDLYKSDIIGIYRFCWNDWSNRIYWNSWNNRINRSNRPNRSNRSNRQNWFNRMDWIYWNNWTSWADSSWHKLG